MTEYTVRFESTNDGSIVLPSELLKSGGKYQIEVRDGDVYVVGNRNGLLYLADVLVRCALGEFTDGMHVHLSLDSEGAEFPESGVADELVVFAATEKRL